jgi:hypothetical protein
MANLAKRIAAHFVKREPYAESLWETIIAHMQQATLYE